MSTRLFSQSWENGLRAGFGKIEMDKGGSLCLKQGFFLASNDVSDKPKRIHHCKTPSTSSNSSLGSSEEDDETASTASTDPSDVEDYADSKPFPSFENQTDESPFPPSPHQPLPHVRLPIPSVINPTSNHLSLKDLAVQPPPPVHSSPLEDTAQFPVHQFEPFVLQSDIDRRLQRLQTASPTGALPLKKLAMMNSHRQVLEDRESQIVKEITRLRSEMQNLLSGQANWAILKKAEWITKRMEYLFWLKDNVPAMKTEFNQMFLKTEATFANSEWNKWEMKKVEISKMRDGAIKKKRNIEVLAEGF